MDLPPKPPRPATAAPVDFRAAFEPKAEVVATPKQRSRGKLQPWMIPTVVTLLQQGMPMKYAAESVGVTRQTLEKWIAEGLERDEAGEPTCTDPLKVELAEQAFQARAKGNVANWTRLRQHAEVDPKTAIHLATIADRETHVEKKEVKVEVGAEPAVELDLSQLTDEQLALKAAYEDMLANAPRKLKG